MTRTRAWCVHGLAIDRMAGSAGACAYGRCGAASQVGGVRASNFVCGAGKSASLSAARAGRPVYLRHAGLTIWCFYRCWNKRACDANQQLLPRLRYESFRGYRTEGGAHHGCSKHYLNWHANVENLAMRPVS
jgi:hypothetical protein